MIDSFYFENSTAERFWSLPSNVFSLRYAVESPSLYKGDLRGFSNDDNKSSLAPLFKEADYRPSVNNI
jgi:hypothetical protein